MALGAITCPRCNGTGKDPEGVDDEPCVTCKGDAIIDDPTEPSEDAEDSAA